MVNVSRLHLEEDKVLDKHLVQQEHNGGLGYGLRVSQAQNWESSSKLNVCQFLIVDVAGVGVTGVGVTGVDIAIAIRFVGSSSIVVVDKHLKLVSVDRVGHKCGRFHSSVVSGGLKHASYVTGGLKGRGVDGKVNDGGTNNWLGVVQGDNGRAEGRRSNRGWHKDRRATQVGARLGWSTDCLGKTCWPGRASICIVPPSPQQAAAVLPLCCALQVYGRNNCVRCTDEPCMVHWYGLRSVTKPAETMWGVLAYTMIIIVRVGWSVYPPDPLALPYSKRVGMRGVVHSILNCLTYLALGLYPGLLQRDLLNIGLSVSLHVLKRSEQVSKPCSARC